MKNSLLLAAALSLLIACDNKSEKDEKQESEWETLFDGASTDALRGYGIEDFPEGIWMVENGELITNPDTANRDLVTKKRYQDFELEYEWAVDTAANSGVFFHVQEDRAMEAGNGNSPNWLDNFEIQILDDKYFNDTAAIRSAGSLYDLITPVDKQLKPIGEFNQARLVHQDGQVEHWLNGKKVLEFIIGSPEMNALLTVSKFKENPEYHSDKEGHIMFQHHGQRVRFKNIRVRAL